MQDRPGFLGLTSQGVVVIHADWPAYPREHGWEVALLTFGDFPQDAIFRLVDSIDQCALFSVCLPGEPTEFHVAVWHEDLIRLSQKGLIEGVEFEIDLTPEQIQLKRVFGDELFDQLRSSKAAVGWARPDGILHPIRFPADDDREELAEWELATPDRLALYQGTEVVLTAEAPTALEAVSRQYLQLPPSVQDRISPFMSMNLLDTAVRELAIALEMRMKAATIPSLFGKRLIDSYMLRVRSSGVFIDSFIKGLDREVRAAMNFVRNEFAHNWVDLSPGRRHTLIARLAELVALVESVNAELK